MKRNQLLTWAVAGCLASTCAMADHPRHCGPPPPDGGPGDRCDFDSQQPNVVWNPGTQVDAIDAQNPGYLETPLRQIAQGEVLELRLQLTLDNVARVGNAQQHAFLELDLDRGDERALWPLHVALQLRPDDAALLHLDGAKAKLQQSAPAHDGIHDLRLHWLQLDASQGELSLILDGRILGTSPLRGTPVAVRLGDLDLGAGSTAVEHIQLGNAAIDWNP